jgi:acyl-CoA thioester hydrolase
MERLGFPYAQLEAEGLFLPLTECQCAFLSGAKYADRLRIRTRIAGIRGVRVTMGYEVVRAADGALLARGATTHVFVDGSFRPINIARVKPALWQAMLSQIE